MAETQRLTDLERANLVAYLDGELNEAEVRALSGKITQSVTARREIEALQKTWELLDFLVRPEPAPDFAGRTLSMALETGKQGANLAAVVSRLGANVGRVAIVAGVAAATLIFGYVSTRWLWPDTTARLVRDLPIAEHFDEYREVGSFDFLKQLADSPVLGEDLD